MFAVSKLFFFRKYLKTAFFGKEYCVGDVFRQLALQNGDQTRNKGGK